MTVPPSTTPPPPGPAEPEQTPAGAAQPGQTPYGTAPPGQTPYATAPPEQTPYGAPPYGAPPYGGPPSGPMAPPPNWRPGWTAGRVVSLIFGVLVGLVALGLITGGAFATWATNSQRDAAGFVSTDRHSFSTAAYAITSENLDLGSSSDWTPSGLLGNLRIRATPTGESKGVFIGVGPQAAVDSYLAGVSHLVVSDWVNGDSKNVTVSGNAPRSAPTEARIWTAQAVGVGTQTLTWRPTGGNWVVVVMNPTGAGGVSVTADAGATIPDLAWIAVGLFAVGVLLLAGALALIIIPIRHANRSPRLHP
jgi:hypothetical protein